MRYLITFRVVEDSFNRVEIEADSPKEALEKFDKNPHEYDWEEYEIGDLHTLDNVECEGMIDEQGIYHEFQPFKTLNNC